MMERATLDTLRRLQARNGGSVGHDDVTIGGAIDEAAAKPPTVDLGLAERLKKRFGLGEDPRKRAVLYRRLETLFIQHGQIVWTLCAEAAAQANGTNNPGRYFCKAILGKLRDNKIVADMKAGDL